MIQIKTSANSFQIGGLLCQKGKVVFNVVDDGIIYQNNRYKFDQVECDGAVMSSQADLVTWLNANVFKNGGGSGDGAVNSVTGNLVTGTAVDPIVSINGTNRDIVTFDDNGDPVSQPIAIQQLTDISGFPSFQNGVFTATAMNAASRTGILSFVEFSTTTPKAGTFATYSTGGVMKVADAIGDDDAVSKRQMPKPSTAISAVASGAGSIGTSANYARQDHVHPIQATVAALTTGRTISVTGGGTGSSAAFNGSANATIPLTLATPTETLRGGVLAQIGIPDLPSNATLGDVVDSYNELLFVLRAAGVLLP